MFPLNVIGNIGNNKISECLYPHQLCERESHLTRDLPRDLGIPSDYYSPLLYTTFGIDICSFSSLRYNYPIIHQIDR